MTDLSDIVDSFPEIAADRVSVHGNTVTYRYTLPGRIHIVPCPKNLLYDISLGESFDPTPASCTYCDYGNGATGLAMLDGSNCPRCNGTKMEPSA